MVHNNKTEVTTDSRKDWSILNAEVIEIRKTIAEVFAKLGMAKETYGNFNNIIGNYSTLYGVETLEGNPLPYREFLDNLSAVVKNVEKMGKRKIKQFETALMKWILTIDDAYFNKGKIDKEGHNRMIRTMFFKLFLQLGTPEFKSKAFEFKRKAIVQDNSDKIANTFNESKKQD